MDTYTGVVAEVGGPELGASGKEKPRKIVIKQDPAAQYGKTFRLWSNSFEFEQLQDKLGQQVTVEFVAEERQGPQGSYTQNLITDVLGSTEGGGNEPGWGSAGNGSPPSDDWSAPKREAVAPASQSSEGGSPRTGNGTVHRQAEAAPTPPPNSPKKGGYEANIPEIEAAWGIGQAIAMGHRDSSKIEELAHQLIILKHKIASEL